MNYSFMDTITQRVAEVLEPKGYQKQNVDTDKDYVSLENQIINFSFIEFYERIQYNDEY